MFRFEMLKPDPSVTGIDFKQITGKVDGLILNKPYWGVVYLLRNNQNRKFKKFMRMDDKEMFKNKFLKNTFFTHIVILSKANTSSKLFTPCFEFDTFHIRVCILLEFDPTSSKMRLDATLSYGCLYSSGCDSRCLRCRMRNCRITENILLLPLLPLQIRLTRLHSPRLV